MTVKPQSSAAEVLKNKAYLALPFATLVQLVVEAAAEAGTSAVTAAPAMSPRALRSATLLKASLQRPAVAATSTCT